MFVVFWWFDGKVFNVFVLIFIWFCVFRVALGRDGG